MFSGLELVQLSLELPLWVENDLKSGYLCVYACVCVHTSSCVTVFTFEERECVIGRIRVPHSSLPTPTPLAEVPV